MKKSFKRGIRKKPAAAPKATTQTAGDPPPAPAGDPPPVATTQTPPAPAEISTPAVVATAAAPFVSENPLVQAALDRISPVVERALEAYEDDKAGVVLLEVVTAAAQTEPALYKRQALPCDTVGVREENRGGAMIIVKKCFEVGKKALKSGYSYTKACDGAVASGTPTSHARLQRAMEMNSRVSISQPDLPPLTCLNAQSMGNGHSNGWLRLAKGKAKCNDPEIAPKGRLDPDALSGTRPGLKKSLTEGITWDVYHDDMFERWPELVPAFINALNTRSTQECTEIEGMLLMSNKRDNMIAHGAVGDYKTECIQAGIVAQPFWQPWASSVYDIVEKTPTESLRFVSDALKTLSPVHESESITHYGYDFLSKVAGLQFKGAKCCVLLKGALLIAQGLSPSSAMDSSRYNLILASDISAITGKTKVELAHLAEDVLATARKICDNHPCASRVRLLGNLDNRVALMMVARGKKSRENKSYSLYEACQAFLEELSETVGRKVVWAPWDALQTPSDAANATGAAAPGAHEKCEETTSESMTIASMKDPVNILKSHGFIINAYVKEKKKKHENSDDEDDDANKKIWKIKSMDPPSGVWLVHAMDAENTQLVTFDNILELFVTTNWKARISVDWDDKSPDASPIWALEFLKANVIIALRDLWASHETGHPNVLKVFDKPRGVQSTVEFKKGDLVLVPASRNVGTRLLTAEAPPGYLDLGRYDCDGLKTGVAMHVAPMFCYKGNNTWVAPFWVVERTKDPDDANMMWNTELVGEMSIKVPTMVNKKAIKPGDELVIEELEASQGKRPKK